MKVAALDLGSNTFLCLICEVEKVSGQMVITKTYADQVEVVRLGQGLSATQKFHPEALVRAKDCLLKFKDLIDQHKPERILAMATSAARDAENKNELFQIGLSLNIPIEIIPGDKEADITYRGSTSGQRLDQSKPVSSLSHQLIVDIGGGSTEFIFGRGSEINFAKSFDIGCVRLTEKFIYAQPTPDEQIKSCQQFIADSISVLPQIQVTNVLAVAGTPTTLAAVEIGKFSVDLIDGYEISLHGLQTWLNRLAGLTIEQKIELGFPKGRADVMLVGVLILIETLKKINLSKIVVSTRGVRHGVALELASRP